MFVVGLVFLVRCLLSVGVESRLLLVACRLLRVVRCSLFVVCCVLLGLLFFFGVVCVDCTLCCVMC